MDTEIKEIKILPFEAVEIIEERGAVFILQKNQLHRIFTEEDKVEIVLSRVARINTLKEGEKAQLQYIQPGIFLGRSLWISHSPVRSIRCIDKPIKFNEGAAT